MELNKLPIYVPDFEVNLRLGKLIILLNELSLNKKDKPVLTLEKISIFEFLTKHPVLLNRILYLKNKQLINLTNSEKYSIEALFPNRGQLFDFKEIKALLNILIGYDFIKIEIGSGFEIYYYISEKGRAYANNLTEEYFIRIQRIIQSMDTFKTLPYSKINQFVAPYLRYGIKN
ncbi:hypothetical protein SAMN05192545_1285 [Maribacter dokdonensis]|uniref:Uncharacterized protein n=1 Tax=Maribacter dokdonensis TaxID=320912 RepID=A0ABY0UAZ1_9FLAO|nr:ABC-three component system middle component 4 [Maribacter dokdonensis]SDS37434.1 hypothetical protein SAMN05192545_1285 [Maribacter dokdonensis]